MRGIARLGFLVLLLAAIAWASPTPGEKQDNQAALQKQTKISMQQAQQRALAKERGTINSRELEKEGGKLIYSFDIRTNTGIHEVNVDAVTGKIVEDSVESKAAEAREKQQENNKPQSPPQ